MILFCCASELGPHEDLSAIDYYYYYVMKQWGGKFKCQFPTTAEEIFIYSVIFQTQEALGVLVSSNISGTGYGCCCTTEIPLMEAIENAVAHEKRETHSAKLMGILKKLRDVCFLSAPACSRPSWIS